MAVRAATRGAEAPSLTPLRRMWLIAAAMTSSGPASCGCPRAGPTWPATALRCAAPSELAYLAFRSMRPVIVAPASVRLSWAAVISPSEAPGMTTSATRRPVRVLSTSCSPAFLRAAFEDLSSSLAASNFSRASSRDARSASTRLERVSPIAFCKGPAPRMMPTASARNTETRETR